MRNLFALLIFLCIPFVLKADQLEPFGYVKQVTQNDGDSVVTSQVSVGVCPGASCPTLISASQTGTLVTLIGTTQALGKTNRKRCFFNASPFQVFIGSNTTLMSSVGYQLSTSTGTNATYCTYNTSAFYAVASSTGTMDVIQETNSQQ